MMRCDYRHIAPTATHLGFISDDGIYYYIKDYQGNIRQVTDDDGNVLQDNHYYPYGMLMAESSDILAANVRTTPSLPSISSSRTLSLVNPYLFGGKEYIPFKGSNYLDFSARIYDNTTITFGTPDPMRSDRINIYPRLYCSGNPVMLIDPTGCTDIICDGYDPVYIEDGANQVVELSTDNYSRLAHIGFDSTNDSYKEIIETGNIRTDLQYTIYNVLKDKPFVPYKKGANCYKLAKEQNNQEIEDASNRIDVFTLSGEKDLDSGIEYVNSELAKGNSVVAGVYTGVDHGNANRLTGHFINIVGVGIEYNNGSYSNFYTYYDNGTSDICAGPNLNNNILHLNLKSKHKHYYDNTGLVRIKDNNGSYRYVRYRLTEIRRNK